MAVEFALYLITDRTLCKPKTLPATVAAACRAGVRAVQLREKDLSPREVLALARRIQAVADRCGAQLFINDRVDIAQAVGAAGVHLTERSISVEAARAILGPRALIGVSTHSVRGAVAAEKGGADFVTFGPIFPTRSKGPDVRAAGLGGLKRVAERVSIPVFAIGGITPDRAAECLRAGASGIACISAVMAAPNVRSAVRAFREAMGRL